MKVQHIYIKGGKDPLLGPLYFIFYNNKNLKENLSEKDIVKIIERYKIDVCIIVDKNSGFKNYDNKLIGKFFVVGLNNKKLSELDKEKILNFLVTLFRIKIFNKKVKFSKILVLISLFGSSILAIVLLKLFLPNLIIKFNFSDILSLFFILLFIDFIYFNLGSEKIKSKIKDNIIFDIENSIKDLINKKINIGILTNNKKILNLLSHIKTKEEVVIL